MKTLLLLPTILSIGALPRLTFAGCELDSPVKRRVIVGWMGTNDSPGFMNALDEARKRVGTVADKMLIAAPEKTRNFMNNNVEWKDGDKLSVFPPTAQGLQEIGRALQMDIAVYLKSAPRTPPSSYELVVLLTNHGTKQVSSKGASYHLTSESPLTDIQAISSLAQYAASRRLPESELRKFASDLPPGIRVKIISGQCYGSDTQDQILRSLKDPTCACGMARAQPGAPATGFMIGLDEEDAIKYRQSISNWEGHVVQGKSQAFAEAAWRATLNETPNRIGKTAGAFDSNIQPSGNAFSLSSERLMIRALLKSPKVKLYFSQMGIHQPDPEDFDLHAQDILSLIPASSPGGTKSDLQLLADSSRSRDAFILNLLGQVVSGNWENNRALANRLSQPPLQKLREPAERYSSKLQKLMPLWESLAQFEGSDDNSDRVTTLKKTIDNLSNETRAAKRKYEEVREALGTKNLLLFRLNARNDLENAFLRMATPMERQEFIQLRRCELEMMWSPLPRQTNAESSSTTDPSVH